eukprot:jgi/Bigna1/74793/fgenesh1_pg.31_\
MYSTNSAQDPTLSIDVYCFAPPACVCENLAKRCLRRGYKLNAEEEEEEEEDGGSGGNRPKEDAKDGTGPRNLNHRSRKYMCPGKERETGVRVLSMVLGDDAVPRASTKNILTCAHEIVSKKGQWKPALQRHVEDIRQRAMGLWAPMKRATHWYYQRTTHGASCASLNSWDAAHAVVVIVVIFAASAQSQIHNRRVVSSLLQEWVPEGGDIEAHVQGPLKGGHHFFPERHRFRAACEEGRTAICVAENDERHVSGHP